MDVFVKTKLLWCNWRACSSWRWEVKFESYDNSNSGNSVMVARRIFSFPVIYGSTQQIRFSFGCRKLVGPIPPSPTIYAGVAQLVEQRFKGFLTTETYSRYHWLLTRGSQVRVLSPAQNAELV